MTEMSNGVFQTFVLTAEQEADFREAFRVETDPAPEGALEAFHAGRLLIDTTGVGFLCAFIKKHQLQLRVEDQPEAVAQALGEAKPRSIYAVKKRSS